MKKLFLSALFALITGVTFSQECKECYYSWGIYTITQIILDDPKINCPEVNRDWFFAPLIDSQFCNILPVELLYFVNESNTLHWATGVEINNSHFIVEHSVDGLSWNPVHQEYGNGNSTNIIYYYWTHDYPENGINYYRLTQYDYDGNYEVFNIVSFMNESKEIEYFTMIGEKIYDINSYTGFYIIKDNNSIRKEFK